MLMQQCDQRCGVVGLNGKPLSGGISTESRVASRRTIPRWVACVAAAAWLFAWEQAACLVRLAPYVPWCRPVAGTKGKVLYPKGQPCHRARLVRQPTSLKPGRAKVSASPTLLSLLSSSLSTVHP